MGTVEPSGVRGFRIVLAAFLVAMVLVVVLLTCLLELISRDNTAAVGLPRDSTASGPPPDSTVSGSPPAAVNTRAPPIRAYCPDNMPGLARFPDLDGKDVVLDQGIGYILDRSVNVNTISIGDGATLVIADKGTEITIRTKYILVDNQGSLIIGSQACPYMSKLNIVLFGITEDQSDQIQPFGRKFIGVSATGSIDIQGPWKLSWTFLQTTIQPGTTDVVIDLADDATSWKMDDKIVIASSDYNMEHAEQFSLLDCPQCSKTQVRIKGPIQFVHLGKTDPNGADMRAEVGLLSRNIKISGEMQPTCTKYCNVRSFDTFGGQIKVLKGAIVARFYGIELFNMGQQEITSMYPIHFHRVFDATGYYAKQLSIHNCFSRCVAIHATQNLLVEDVVGYDTLGHCFFFSDGNEVNNTVRHSLALVTRSGTILPTDRNASDCQKFTTNASRYSPDPDKECRAVSSFFITHPNNIIEDNAAGGSEEMGFFYTFYREPPALSKGTLPPFDSERSPLGSFARNRAHSNQKAGFFMGRGIKITAPSADDPRDTLALIDGPKYAPHINKNLSQPRAPAQITKFTGYKNSLGMFVRGGDVWIDNARLSDNDVGVIMASSDHLPYDAGSQQKFVDSIIVGQSNSKDADWNSRLDSQSGVQIQNGPLLIANTRFINFTSTSNRESYAMSFYPNNKGQNSPKNTIVQCSFEAVTEKLSIGEIGMGSQSDGNLNQVLQDSDGSITGQTASSIIGLNNPILMTSSCKNSSNIIPCTNVQYGQLFLNVSSKSVQLLLSDAETNQTITLFGADHNDSSNPSTNQFQPIVIANRRYRVAWANGPTPAKIDLSMYNFNRNQTLQLELCYPTNTTFNISTLSWDQATGNVLSSGDVTKAADMTALKQMGVHGYYWDSTTGWLYVRMVNSWQAVDSDYCPVEGCQLISITSNIQFTQPYSQCN